MLNPEAAWLFRDFSCVIFILSGVSFFAFVMFQKVFVTSNKAL